MQWMDELTGLDDAALHGELKHTVGRANTLTARLIAQLGELEARGLYRERACSSLYTYCIYELRMSEDEAQRRCRAARLARQFPVLLQMLTDSSIHLTGILLLGPHLTVENHAELLARARHRTKREIERLLAAITPAADVPTLVVPLRRAGADEGVAQWQDSGAQSPRPRNTWAAFMQALAGPVRRLQPGIAAGQAPSAPVEGERSTKVEGKLQTSMNVEGARTPTPPHEPGSNPSTAMRYRVQFSADQAYVDLLEEARDLLQHELPDRNLVEVQRRALELLVEQLRRRKHAATDRPRPPAQQPSVAVRSEPKVRHLPAALRRAVWQRDAGRCAYFDARAVRCRETAGLEFHHLEPYARGGANSEQNIALRCRAHNALAAEHDFGAERMRQCRQRGGDPEHRAGAASLSCRADGGDQWGLGGGAHPPSPG